MAERIYTIKSTDGTLVFDISPKDYDGVGGTSQNTDLLLPGNNHFLWGDKLNQSLLRMLENFACEQNSANTPKTSVELGAGQGINKPIVGQLWFNKTDNALYVYNTEETWVQLSTGGGGTTGNYLPLSGGTLTGPLTLSANPTNNLHAATKQYVDSEITSALTGGSAGNYVAKSGDTMTGFLTLHANPTSNMHAATKQYVEQYVDDAISSGGGGGSGGLDTTTADTRYVNVSGDTMVGFLTLNANPTSGLHAATKQYVDSVAGSGGGGSTSEFTSGTTIVFYQTTAPTGWTQITSINDRMLRVVSSGGGGSGGDWTTASVSVTINGHAITVAEMPAHSHPLSSVYCQDLNYGSLGNQSLVVENITSSPCTTLTASSVGGGAAHTHGATVTGNSSWRPAYVNVIIASKD